LLFSSQILTKCSPKKRKQQISSSAKSYDPIKFFYILTTQKKKTQLKFINFKFVLKTFDVEVDFVGITVEERKEIKKQLTQLIKVSYRNSLLSNWWVKKNFFSNLDFCDLIELGIDSTYLR
jgi:hypothetical protein